MKTNAVRLYGKMDLRLETFDLPEITDGEVLMRIVSDSLCMSSYKAALQGGDHKRVPDDVANHPVIIGHEFCGVIEQVGEKWKSQYQTGQKAALQPAIPTTMDAPGYSFAHVGGDATYVIIPEQYLRFGALLPYDGDAFFYGSLAEPMSCIIGAFHAQYHTDYGSYQHKMGIVPGGRLAILAGAGPMGLGAVDYAVRGPVKPSVVVVTDIDEQRLAYAQKTYSTEAAQKQGVTLIYLNTANLPDPAKAIIDAAGSEGFDDVFCMAPVAQVVQTGDTILKKDGCLNFFAGPTDKSFSASFNFYNVHYAQTHIVGTSGGNVEDMKEALYLMGCGQINPAGMVTHIGGLDAVAAATKNLPHIPGGKKLIYTQLRMPLTALADLPRLGKNDPLMQVLAEMVERHGGLWNLEAEQYLLRHAQRI